MRVTGHRLVDEGGVGWVSSALVLYAVAVLIRLPFLATIPAPTDETDAMLLALQLAHGGAWPLTGENAYLGPLHVYLAALAFRLFGETFTTARMVSLFLNALSVPAHYLVAAQVAGRRAGLVAAALAALAFGPVLVGSHIFWSHGSAAGFLGFALVSLRWARTAYRGQEARPRLVLAGFCFGLALAAHPTTLALWPGIGLWWLASIETSAEPWGRLRDSIGTAPWIALGGLAAYAPNLLFILTHGGQAVLESSAGQEYVGLSLATWPGGVLAWLEGLARNLAGPPSAAPLDLRFGVVAVVCMVALVQSARRKEWLPVAAIASGALLMPLMMDPERFRSFTGLRYTAPALPMLAAAIAGWLADSRAAGAEASADVGGFRRLMARWSWKPVALAGLFVLQATAVVSYYREQQAAGVTGAPILEVTRGLKQAATDGHSVFVDHGLDTKLGGGGEVGRAVGAILTLEAVPYTAAKVDKMRWYLLNATGATLDLVLSGAAADDLGDEFALETLREVPVVGGQVSRSGSRWGWFRYTVK